MKNKKFETGLKKYDLFDAWIYMHDFICNKMNNVSTPNTYLYISVMDSEHPYPFPMMSKDDDFTSLAHGINDASGNEWMSDPMVDAIQDEMSSWADKECPANAGHFQSIYQPEFRIICTIQH